MNHNTPILTHSTLEHQCELQNGLNESGNLSDNIMSLYYNTLVFARRTAKNEKLIKITDFPEKMQ